MQTAPTPHPINLDGFMPRFPAQNSLCIPSLSGDLEAARAARQTKMAGWAALPLRQRFADEAWMREHIKAAGLRAPVQIEPATVPRLRTLLKRAQVTGQEITDSVGTTLAGYLRLNPLLPLWAALALVLEATGRFSRTATESLGTYAGRKT